MSADATASAELLLERQDGEVLTLTLNRPQRLNALSTPMLERFITALTALKPETRVVVIKGAGRAFCSGHDLKSEGAAGQLDQAEAREVAEGMQDVARAMRASQALIVTAVHGYAIGGGAEIALSGDFVVVERDAVFQFTEADVGRMMTNGFTQLLPRTVGPVRAKALAILGERFTGADVEAWGLATMSVSGLDALEPAVDALVRKLAAKAPLSVRAAKRLIDLSAEISFETSLRLESDAAVLAEISEDSAEGANAFLEGRSPAFLGR